MPRYSNIGFNAIFALLGTLVLLFIVAPLVSMFLHTEFPAMMETVREPEVQASIKITLLSAAFSTLFFALAAIPFSWLLARKQFVGKTFLQALIDLPIVIPHTAAGIALLGFVSRDTVLGQMAESVGLSFVGSPLGIGLAMAFVSIPFLINASRDAFAAVPKRLELTARNLGASPFRCFFTVSLPLAWRGVLSGLIMMFARGMSEFGAVVIIAYHPMTTPVMIFERFTSYGLKYTRPVAVLFIIVALVIFYLLRYFAKPKHVKHTANQ
jgi:molybdate/tungstate transport system permease protein